MLGFASAFYDMTDSLWTVSFYIHKYIFKACALRRVSRHMTFKKVED